MSQVAERIKNGAAAMRWLEERGYVVPCKTVFYDDIKVRKKLRRQPDKSFLATDLEAYGEIHLARADAPEEDESQTPAGRRELARAEREELNLELDRLRLLRERGEMIPRAELDQHLVDMVTILRSVLEQQVVSMAAELVSVVRGDPARVRDAVAFLEERQREAFHGLSLPQQYLADYTEDDVDEYE